MGYNGYQVAPQGQDTAGEGSTEIQNFKINGGRFNTARQAVLGKAQTNLLFQEWLL